MLVDTLAVSEQGSKVCKTYISSKTDQKRQIFGPLWASPYHVADACQQSHNSLTLSTHQSEYPHCISDALLVPVHRGIFQRNLGLRGWWVDWVRDIVLNMHGQDLTALKNAMDDGGDAHNIHKLIYNDILVCASQAMYPGLLLQTACAQTSLTIASEL